MIDSTVALFFWDSSSIDRDTLFFIKDDDKPRAAASLLFVPKSIPVLRSATGDTNYMPGSDFIWESGSRRIELPIGSRIPFKNRGELYPDDNSPHSIPGARDRVGKSLLFGEGHFFHDLQTVAAYEPKDRWTGIVPQRKHKLLPKTMARLKNNDVIRLVVLGDSISTGANASGVIGVKPNLPGYPDLFARGLEKFGSHQVTLTNLSVGGTTSAWGVTRVQEVITASPGLLVIAFGMNDANGISPDEYAGNVRTIISEVRKALPDCEFIVVAGMIGNPEWNALNHERFDEFRDELEKLEEPGIAAADVTSLWIDLLERKSFHDLTGNGVNHPNDFGHEIYAAVLLELLASQPRN